MDDHELDPISVLIAAFPRLFRGKQPHVWSDPPMGWFDLVWGALRDVDAVLAGSPDHGRLEIEQIKEKFGRLRIYWKLAREGGQVLSVHEETPSRLGRRLGNRRRSPWQFASVSTKRSSRVRRSASAAAPRRQGRSPPAGWSRCAMRAGPGRRCRHEVVSNTDFTDARARVSN